MSLRDSLKLVLRFKIIKKGGWEKFLLDLPFPFSPHKTRGGLALLGFPLRFTEYLDVKHISHCWRPLQLQGDIAAIHDLFHPLTVSFFSFPVCYRQFARVSYVIFDCVLLKWSKAMQNNHDDVRSLLKAAA
jgi:hypothetical protein